LHELEIINIQHNIIKAPRFILKMVLSF